MLKNYSNTSKINEFAKNYADRHQLAEMELRGLSSVYSYSRIYNAEITAYEHGAGDVIDKLERCYNADKGMNIKDFINYMRTGRL